ncbi:hypothetical protein ACM64Y_15860 [Novispirillum sp. DQ9]|uniref:hypothetical protein n=1 Tax=Novispirillum sp. DQ9 TaxID=3398612 RepID=UPI003C7BC969
MARKSRRQRESSARFWSGLFKLGFTAGMIGAAAWFAYETGRQLSTDEIADLNSRIQTLEATATNRQQEVERLQVTQAAAEARAEEFRQRYEDVAPEAVRAIITQARAKIDAGLSPDRLAFVISQAEEPRSCTPAETRRFIAKTQNYDGANTWVRFNDVLTISAAGQAASDGRAEWFDPGADVTMTFSPLGGKAQEISGKLPLQHAMVFKGREYRFTATPGQRGFIEVTGDWCAFAPSREAEALMR